MTRYTRRLEQHLTRLLGPPSRLTAARDSEDNRKAAFALGLFDDVPAEGAFTLVSSGISEHELRDEEGAARVEILFSAWNRFRDGSLEETLFTLGDTIIDAGTVIHTGLLYELPRTVTDNTVMRHLLAYPPTYFDDALASVDVDGGTIGLVWMIPLHEEEADFIEAHGADAFADLLAEHDPDLLDLRRQSIVTPDKTD
jgi:hypothetical protein